MRVSRRKSSVLRNGQKWCKESLFTLMEDGAPVHRALSTKKWHANHGVKLFGGWPGISPNLNPIENLWSEMKNLQRKEQTTLMEGLKKSPTRYGEPSLQNTSTSSMLQCCKECRPFVMHREAILTIKKGCEL